MRRASSTPRRATSARSPISPNGNWLLVGWVNANQWLFLRLTSAKVESVSNIVEQFGGKSSAPLASSFPKSVSWCCPASP